MGTGYRDNSQTRERGIYGPRMGYYKSMSKCKCKHCGVEFTPTRGAKGFFCSSKCRDAFNSQRWESFKHCIKCHASLGLTGAASGRLIGIEKSKVSLIKKKYKIKALNNSEAQIAKNAHKNIRADLRCDWDTWWGGRDNAKLWMTEHKNKFPNWGNHAEVGKWRYHKLSPEQKRKINQRRILRFKERIKSDPKVKEKQIATRKKWERKNKKRLAIQQKKWRSANRDKFSRRKMNPQQRAKDNMRKRFKDLVKTTRKGGAHSFSKTIGCTTNWLRKHIESQWEPWMSWANYGSGGGRTWHIDHIIPCAAFDQTDPHQVKTCWHWTNLRPLCSNKNMNKSDKWGIEEMAIVISNLNLTGTLQNQ